MSKWRIRGANLQTGAEITIEIEAADAMRAMDQARALGLAVASVDAVGPTVIVQAAPPPTAAAGPSSHVTTEATRKDIKVGMIVCVLFGIMGLFWFVMWPTMGGIICTASGIGLAVLSAFRWWHHG